MPGYKLIVKNAKVILKTVTNAVLNISGIKDLLTGSGSLDSNNKIDWTLQEYTNTAANFTSNNPILLLGQKGIETDDLLTAPKFKIGNGVTAWNTLPYANIGGGGGGGVPYTGATSDVNLGEFGIQLGNLEFDNTPTNVPTNAGSLVWNDTDGTLDLKLKGGNVTLQVGQEQVTRVLNKTATNITLLEANYQAVRITGAQGQRLKVDLALATTDVLSAETIGLVTETIANNQQGFITTSGLIRGINTTGSLQGETWADGDILYLSGVTAGQITNVKPTAPIHLIVIGYVVHSHITQGTIYVKVDNGYELGELHNVYINPSTLANNDVLTYDSSSSLWKNKQSNYLQIVSKDITDSTALTGTTAITLMKSVLIPANTYATGDIAKLLSRAIRNTSTGVAFNYFYVNTINSLTGATLIGNQSGVYGYFGMERSLYIKSLTNTETINTASVSGSEVAIVANGNYNINIDWTVNQYIISAFKNASVGDSTVMSSLIIQKY